MSSNDDVAFTIVFSIVVVLWAFVPSVLFWDACLNTSGKKNLMDDYDSAGVETMAMVIRQQVTIHTRNCAETHRTQRVHYAYQVPGSEDRLIFKQYEKKHCAGLEVLPPVGLIVKVLPGFPLSGLPKFQIDERGSDYGLAATVQRGVLALALVFLAAILLLAVTEMLMPLWFLTLPSGIQVVLSMIVLLLFGLPFAPWALGRWKKAQLQKCDKEELSLSPRTTPAVAAAGATIIRHGDESHVPLATAVPVGDIETAESGNDVPLLPDALAEIVLNEAKCLSLQTIVARLDDFREGMWDVRSSYVHLAASHWSSKTLTPLVGCPDTAVGNLFRGVYYIYRAWDIRGSNSARNVQRNVWPEFHRGLSIAQESLLRAAEQDPEDPTPYAFLAGSVAMGLQVSKEQAFEWFAAAIARDPINRVAHFGRLSALCEKWGGSHEEMFAFARATMRRCPDDGYLRVILLDAFFEKWLLVSIDNKRKANDYLRSSKVRDEALAIYQQCVETRVIADISQVTYHARVTKFLLHAGFEAEAQRELQKLRPWTRILLHNQDIVSAALRNPDVVGQCASSLRW
jgi:hypothetical protein